MVTRELLDVNQSANIENSREFIGYDLIDIREDESFQMWSRAIGWEMTENAGEYFDRRLLFYYY